MALFKSKKTKPKGETGVSKLARQVAGPIRKMMGNVSTKTRLEARIRYANIKATENPKKWFLSLTAILAGFTVITLVLCFISDSESPAKTIQEIPPVMSTFNGLQNVEVGKERTKEAVRNFYSESVKLANEIDSLSQLPNKTHEDSVKIYRNYLILKDLHNLDNHEEN